MSESVTNSDRSDWVENALDTFSKETFFRPFKEAAEDEGVDTITRDFLADMMHFCDRHGLDFHDQLRMAQSNYEEEVAEENERV